MGEKIVRTLYDDMEGEGVPADQTINFGLDNVDYEIDVSSKNAMGLRASLEKYIKNARVVGRRKATVSTASRPRGSALSSGMSTEQLKAMREWLRRNGHPNLSDKGRVPKDLQDEYHNAMNKPELEFSS